MGKCTHLRWNPEEPVNHAPLTNGNVNSLLNETLKKLLKRVPLTHGKVYSLEMKPWGTSKPCTSERQESTLTGEWNHDEAPKACTSDTRNSEFRGKWNHKETSDPRTCETWESTLTGVWNPDETTNLIKSVNHTPLTHGKWIPWWIKPWWNQ